MNNFNLPKGLLDSVTSVLKTAPRDNTPLQEKLVHAHQDAVKSATNFDKAVASVVAEDRKKEAERQAKFAEAAVGLHKGMGKSIVESIEVKQEVAKQDTILDESVFAELAARMKNVGSTRRLQNFTEQKETITQMARTFAASFDQIVEANVAAELRNDAAIQEALQAVKLDIRNQMLNSVNVASAARVVDEASKIVTFIAVQEALKGKQHKLDANKNGKIDAHDFEVLKSRKARGQGEAVDEQVETVEEGWDDMLKDVKSKMAPQPNGGSGVKKGKRYGGAAQKNDTEEKKDVKEGVMAKVKSLAKKAVEKLGHGSDEDMIKDLQKKAGVPQTGKKPAMKEEVEQLDELSPGTLGSYVKKATSDVRMNTNMARNTTGKQSDKFAAKAWKREDNVGKAVDRLTKEEVEQVEEAKAPEGLYSSKRFETDSQRVARLAKEKRQAVKNTDTPGNSYKHQCAVHVKHSKLGEGKTLHSQHAQPDADGNIAWYDVMFEEGIKRVDTAELEILVSESHMNHKKKM